MGQHSKIEWCHHTVNFWWGCAFAELLDGSHREECTRCYAKAWAKYAGKGRATWGKDGLRWLRVREAMAEMDRLDASAGKRGVRERVFINSMSDAFEGRADLAPARSQLWKACESAKHLDVLLLTKRPQNVLGMVPQAWLPDWPAHVWIGTTVGTKRAADECVPELLKIPARVRFLSCEPLLEAVRGLNWLPGDEFTTSDGSRHRRAVNAWPGIHWVIAGGESGPGARPMHPDWVRSLRDQCQAAKVPFLFKQWGEHGPIYDARGRENGFARIGKKTAGRMLDGRTWDEVPVGEGKSPIRNPQS